MSPSHAVKNGKRYRYCTSQAMLKQIPEKAGSLPRIPAAEVESAMTRKLNALLTNPLQLSKAISATIEEMNT
ncbi:MAG TPA: recombinase family protein, partial [Gammaproteobacteria bacterium]|nr:recombinase family protein [Gammaproteobacteria bacterium]